MQEEVEMRSVTLSVNAAKLTRKYGVDYAIYKDKSSGEKNKYLIFFKGRDADAITAAFKEYAAKDIKRETQRASVLDKLHNLIERSRNIPATPVKNKDKGLEL